MGGSIPYRDHLADGDRLSWSIKGIRLRGAVKGALKCWLAGALLLALLTATPTRIPLTDLLPSVARSWALNDGRSSRECAKRTSAIKNQHSAIVIRKSPCGNEERGTEGEHPTLDIEHSTFNAWQQFQRPALGSWLRIAILSYETGPATPAISH